MFKRKTITQGILIKLLLISSFFDAYCFAYIGNYPITMYTISGAILILYCIFIKRNNTINVNRVNMYLMLFCLYLIIGTIFRKLINLNSLMQMLMLASIFFVSYRKVDNKDFNTTVELFIKAMNVFAMYGIYQFVGRLIGFPLVSIILPNHMVLGYNTTNAVYFSSVMVYRSNAIFREPSFFSQLLAINILLYLSKITGNKSNRKANIAMLVINIVALIATLAGTGFIILTFGLLIYYLQIINNRKLAKWTFITCIILSVIAIISLSWTSVGQYLLSRVNELFVYKEGAASGYSRFIAWTDILQDEWRSNFVFGIGSSKKLLNKYSRIYYAFTLHGFAKIMIEMGIIGIIIWCLFIVSFLQKKGKLLNNYYLMISSILLPYMFCHETSTSNVYWIFLVILNVKFSAKRSVVK